jgi:regulator of sirC expression with transglutaminase-like and TPR domain
MTFRIRMSCLIRHVMTCLFLVALLAGNSAHADESGPDLDTPAISKLIEQLGSAFFEEREAAAKELRRLGKQALPLLQEARTHKSAEIRSRVAALLRQQALTLGEAIQAFAKQRDEDLNLEEGMWLIARILNPDVRQATLTRQLDQLATAVRKKLGDVEPKSVAPDRMVTVLRDVLFDQEKLGGNFDDYQNPANSSLEKVLETKQGLPILVSQVVIAVGRRLDLPIVGVPTAGRYIVKYDGKRAALGLPTQDIYLDPFNNGKVLTRLDRMELFPDHDPDRMVEPQSARRDLIRMLNNIESHLFNRDEITKAYQAVEFRVALEGTAKTPE